MNAPPFDPYDRWLGISPSNQPPNHYQLLGLTDGESDPTLITAAADQRLAIVESQRGGPEQQHCDPLCRELRAARDCLLDPGTRASYDAALNESRIPMALPVAPPTPLSAPPTPTEPMTAAPPSATSQPVASVAAAEAPVSPIAPPVATRGNEGNDDPAAPERGRSSWAWLVITMSVVGIGIAVWLITTSLLGDPNALTAEGDNPTQGAPVEPEPTTELPPTVNEPVVVMQEGTGNVVLRPVLAILSGVELDQSGEEDVLAHWGADGEAWWRFRIIKPAIFRVVVRYAAEDAWAGAQVELSLGDQKKTVTVRASGGTDQFHEDEYFLAANSSGQHDFRVRAVGLAGEGLMVLKSIQLEPRTGNLPK